MSRSREIQALGPLGWLQRSTISTKTRLLTAAVRLACAQHAHRLLGSQTTALLVLGRALRANGRLDEALTVLKSVPLDSAGSAQATQERTLAELESRTQSIELDPATCWRYGKHLLEEKETERAHALFDQLVTRMPERPEGNCGLGWLAFLDDTLSQSQRLHNAHELCEKALAEEPEFGPAHELMGMILRSARSCNISLSNPLSPIDHFKRAVELDPTCDIALEAIADNYIDEGDVTKAVDLLEKAAALNTKLNGVYFKLAVFYQAMRQPKKQAQAYQRAKDLAPNLELASEYKNKLLDICGFEY